MNRHCAPLTCSCKCGCCAACTMRGDSDQRLHLAADQKQAAARTSDLTILLACAWLGIMRCAKLCLAMTPRCSCCKAANHGPSRDDAATRARERAVALPSALTAQRRISLATDGRACACTFVRQNVPVREVWFCARRVQTASCAASCRDKCLKRHWCRQSGCSGPRGGASVQIAL